MADEDDDGVVTHSFSFEVGPDVRNVNDDAIEAFDRALADVGDGEVMHLMDPTRINAFGSGGPPTWSVASVVAGPGTLYLTYGLSEAIDPSQAGRDFELSIHVAGAPTMWPGLFLRALARYMLQSGRELQVGQYMPFPDALTRFFAPPSERDNYPDTPMNAAFFADDPILPIIATPRGAVTIRRAVGMHPDELALMELWSTEGFVRSLLAMDPRLSTDVERASHATHPELVAAIEAGSRQHGSDFSFVAVDGVTWSDEDGSLLVRLPGGAQARRIHRMISARLPFGNHLLVHDTDPANERAVAFEPSPDIGLRIDGSVVVLSLPADHELVASLAEAPEEGITWKLG